jgi:hypothetical protein
MSGKAKVLLGCTLLYVGFSGIVFAADLGEQVKNSLEATEKANKYSFDTGGVGVLFTYGKKNEMAAKDIGEAFVRELNKRGEKARYFYYATERDGSAIEFHIRHSVLGTWSPQYAASNIDKVVKRAQAARKVLGH